MDLVVELIYFPAPETIESGTRIVLKENGILDIEIFMDSLACFPNFFEREVADCAGLSGGHHLQFRSFAGQAHSIPGDRLLSAL